MKSSPRFVKKEKMTKEEFMIKWVLARASFRQDFSECAAVRAAQNAWNEIQKLKEIK
jgi:hypothetical protein